MRALNRVVGGLDPALLVTLAVAAVVFWLAYDNGSYSLPSRAAFAIVVWWAVIVGLALQLFGTTVVPRATLVVGGLLVALAAWTLASVLWASSAEDAFNEFNRVTLYLGVYVFVVLASSRRTVGRWADGLALAVVLVAVVALASRLFPGALPEREVAEFLPSAASRLSFPLGYWNGLAILVALGVPLLLRIALVAAKPAVRGLALAPVPVLASVIYLASSRGGVVTAALGTFVFVLLTERRWSAAAAVVVSGIASGVAIGALAARDELVDGPLGTSLVRDQGRTAAILVGLACVGSALGFGLGCRFLGGRLQPGRRTGRVVVALGAAAIVVGIAASDPVGRFETFKTSPAALDAIEPGGFGTAHLLSGSGSGRWQFWTAAIDQWTANPLLGAGAGSYEQWWAEHASFTYSLRDAHSLYLETLGELGPLGFVLVVALVVAGASAGVRRSLRSVGEDRVTRAALTAVFVAYAAAAGLDWIWELAGVTVVGLAALALVTGPATAGYEPLRRARPDESPGWPARHRFGLGVVAGLTAWVLIVAQAVPLLVDREIARSQAAVESGELEEAIEAAEVARDVQPWASTPYLQLALVAERSGDLERARTWIEEAIERDGNDWQLWLVSARLETKLGDVAAARRSLHRAAELNPRSPLFAGLLDQLAGSD